jgi:hypothetical protein
MGRSIDLSFKQIADLPKNGHLSGYQSYNYLYNLYINHHSSTIYIPCIYIYTHQISLWSHESWSSPSKVQRSGARRLRWGLVRRRDPQGPGWGGGRGRRRLRGWEHPGVEGKWFQWFWMNHQLKSLMTCSIFWNRIMKFRRFQKVLGVSTWGCFMKILGFQRRKC